MVRRFRRNEKKKKGPHGNGDRAVVTNGAVGRDIDRHECDPYTKRERERGEGRGERGYQ